MPYTHRPEQYSDKPSQAPGHSGGYDQGGPGGRGGQDSRNAPKGQRPTYTFTPEKSPGNEFAFENIAAVSPHNFNIKGRFELLINGLYVVTAVVDVTIKVDTIGLTTPQRKWMRVSLGKFERVIVEHYQPSKPDPPAAVLTIELAFASRASVTTDPIDEDDLIKKFNQTYSNQLLSPHQSLVIEFQTVFFQGTIKSVLDPAGIEIPPSRRARVSSITKTTFTRDSSGEINLKTSRLRPAANSLIDTSTFDIKDLGVGGLDDQINTIVRRAFTSRAVPSRILEDFSIKHVKGILLYGPPGTGKTLMARQLAKVLKAHKPKIVNGPELLSKWVGQSEENIRELFGDAEKEFKEKGMDSTTHVIIFDELDAICKARGSGGAGGAGVTDNIVNQLLTKMDGVDELGNILIIGMTNRKDLIDPALLRPGRLELQIEISLPNEKGREDILKIVLAKALENNRLASDVDIPALAHAARNFTGAELTALWHAAFSYSHPMPSANNAEEGENEYESKQFIVSKKDFLLAFNDIKAMHGAKIDGLERHIQHDIIRFNDKVKAILDVQSRLVSNLGPKSWSPIYSILLEGVPYSGTTALAAKLALSTDAPSIQIIEPKDLVGMGPTEVIRALQDAFELAYKSEQSVLVIDRIEEIIRWMDIGPRFVPDIVFTLLALLSTPPPKNNRLVVIATTSKVHALGELDLLHPFKNVLTVPTIESAEHLYHVFAIFSNFGFHNQQVAKSFWEGISHFRGVIGVKAVIESLFQVLPESGSNFNPMNCLDDFVAHLSQTMQTKTSQMRLPKQNAIDDLAAMMKI